MSRKQARRRDKVGVSSAAAGSNKFGYDYSKDYKDPSWPYAQGKFDRCAWFLIIAVPVTITLVVTYFWYMNHLRELVRTPLAAPLVISPSLTSAAESPDRFWGTYRAGVYFGLKARRPHSPLVGLMWMSQLTREMPPSIRHWCEQGDGLDKYGWLAHDGLNFGIQEIKDKHYTIITDFVKRPGGEHGGDWTARITVNPKRGSEKVVVSLFFYVALDGDGWLEAETQKNRLTGIRGQSSDLGSFHLSFPRSAHNTKKSNYLLTYTPGLHHLKEVMMNGFRLAPWSDSDGRDKQYLALRGRLVPRDAPTENFMVHQVTVELPFTMEVMYESESFSTRPNSLSGDIYQAELQSHFINFNTKFESVFNLQAKGFNQTHLEFAQAALSNMIGGVGYFYGSSLVASKYTDKGPVPNWEAPLLTAVPSRSFFPRGFLWDEGFHNLLISKWDQELSMEILGHWLDLMNVEGWIPREQILGEEARVKVPTEFITQHNENANPPTLFLPLQGIVQSLASSTDPRHKTYLQHLYPRLQAWYSWFNTSQVGNRPSSYRWRGRSTTTLHELNPKTLTSGLDDYPRASHPSQEEMHVDLRCWMALASGVMADIAASLDEPREEYSATHRLLTDNKLLDDLHWSDVGQQYSDYGLHTDHVRLERPRPKSPPHPGQPPPPPEQKKRVVLKEPRYGYVNQFGYVSLFPFLLHIVDPASPKLGHILRDIQDSNLLWTKYGLRSLAKTSPLYSKHNTEHDPPYWRGYVWINLNYLTIRALHHYSYLPGPHRQTAAQIYSDLRHNVVTNIVTQYTTTGYVWENYDDKTGQGRGSHPFTGWSALVVAIMAEEY